MNGPRPTPDLPLVFAVDADVALRHDHRLRNHSRDVDLLFRLRSAGIDGARARQLVTGICDAAGVVPPEVRTHRRRSPHTGLCMSPRAVAVDRWTEKAVAAWEGERRRRWPELGEIRIGDPTTVATVAHEVAHHLVHLHEPPETPAHGKVWVRWFDETATSAVALLDKKYFAHT